jgi:hypothetical protein
MVNKAAKAANRPTAVVTVVKCEKQQAAGQETSA